jgi:PKD domain-containing protein/fibronectin type III domain protein
MLNPHQEITVTCVPSALHPPTFGKLVGICVVAIAAASCSRSDSRAPAAPTPIGHSIQVQTSGAGARGTAVVDWTCFTRSRQGGFGASACPTTTASFLAAPLDIAPDPPTGLTQSVSGTTVTLTWTAPSTTGSGGVPTSYVVEAGSASGLSDLASFDTGGSATTLTVTNVAAGTYFVRVRGANARGIGAPSNEVVVRVVGTVACNPVPAPSGLSSAISGTTVTLTWTAPAGCTPTGYIIQAGTAPGLSNLANFSTGSTATSYTAFGVANGIYFVRVLASSGGVSSPPSNEVPLTIGCSAAPGAPAFLSGNVTGSTVTLSWAPGSGCGATSYSVEAGSAPGASNLAVVAVPASSTTFRATSVGNGTYYIRVRAANAFGASAPSSEIVVNVGTNSPPTGGSVQVSPVSGLATFSLFTFDIFGASDPDNDPLTFTFLFDDGTTQQSARSVSKVYSTPGAHVVRAQVSDGRNPAVDAAPSQSHLARSLTGHWVGTVTCQNSSCTPASRSVTLDIVQSGASFSGTCSDGIAGGPLTFRLASNGTSSTLFDFSGDCPGGPTSIAGRYDASADVLFAVIWRQDYFGQQLTRQ